MSAFATLRPGRSLAKADTLAALLFFLLLAIAWTWPLATQLSSRIANDRGDPVLNAWILWWSSQALPLTSAWWNAPVFYPIPGALALSEHLLGIALFTAPLQLAGAGPATCYNVALIASGWLSGFFAFLLGRYLTGSTLAGLVCGVAFACAPYRASQLAHLQVLSAQWMPLALLGMHGYVKDGRRRWLALFAVAWLLQALSNGYYLLFFPVLVGAWLLCFGSLRQKAVLAATFVVASLPLLPVLLTYREVHGAYGLTRNLGETLMFSARPSSFLHAAAPLALWPPSAYATPEADLFPGIVAPLVAVLSLGVALVRRHEATRLALFYVAATLLFCWLCLGPADSGSLTDALARPYTVLTWLPGFSGLRVPARFAMLAALCLAVAAAVGIARVLPSGRIARRVVAAILLAGILADGWIEPMTQVFQPSRFPMPDAANAVVIELPLDVNEINVEAMYRSIGHQRPLVNGYSGYIPPAYGLLAMSLRRGDPSALHLLAAGRPLVILIHREHDPSRDWRALVEGAGGVLYQEAGLGPVMVLPPQPRTRPMPPTVQVAAKPLRSEAGYAVVDLESARLVRMLAIDLEKRYPDVGERVLIESSLDGTSWTKAWEGWTGAPAFIGALEDPLRVPMKIVLPDIRARYVRISPVATWVAEALQVYE